ncbi:MAG: hypothetical protein A3I66_18035 [Burkholderiales bacterium RIFCSPLOWO2_02_FULL_57_36]|nr:MAG: hypothetical protein A3I66_18035 [Burkholderiales bacterium RIFCSPLOWO2_02_FULL_57_36]
MSILGVLIRFFLAYIVLMIVAVVALRALGIASNSGVNVGILIGAVLWPSMAFGTKNGRYFNRAEKIKVVWGMIGINLALQLLVGGGALAAEGRLSSGALVVALAFVGVIHSVAIYYFVGLAGKLLEKQAKKVAAGG